MLILLITHESTLLMRAQSIWNDFEKLNRRLIYVTQQYLIFVIYTSCERAI